MVSGWGNIKEGCSALSTLWGWETLQKLRGWRWLLNHKEELDNKQGEWVRRGFWVKGTAYAKVEAWELMVEDPLLMDVSWSKGHMVPSKGRAGEEAGQEEEEVAQDSDLNLVIK